MDETEREGIARRLAEIACAAGEVLRHHHAKGCSHSLKPDGSPASVADIEAEALILAALAERFPDIPAVAEETCHDRKPAARFFLVDPLDGTREFLAGTPEYAVCIALVAGERPVAAALAAPGPWRRRSRRGAPASPSAGAGATATRRPRPASPPCRWPRSTRSARR